MGNKNSLRLNIILCNYPTILGRPKEAFIFNADPGYVYFGILDTVFVAKQGGPVDTRCKISTRTVQ